MDSQQETIDYIAIRRLQSAYADGVSRRAWNEVAALFADDAVIELNVLGRDPVRFESGAEIASFIDESIANMDFFQFLVLNTVLDIGVDGDDDRAEGRLWMSELRQFAASGHFTQIWGLYRDRYVRRDGRWLFGFRRYQTLARTTPDLMTFPFPED